MGAMRGRAPAEGVAEDQTEGGEDAPLGVGAGLSAGVHVWSEGETSPT
jgi:hypothetical protein